MAKHKGSRVAVHYLDTSVAPNEYKPWIGSQPLAIRLDDGTTYLYVGKAAIGTANSSATWQIMRITQSDTTVVWADGNAEFDNVWDNRAALSYS